MDNLILEFTNFSFVQIILFLSLAFVTICFFVRNELFRMLSIPMYVFCGTVLMCAFIVDCLEAYGLPAPLYIIITLSFCILIMAIFAKGISEFYKRFKLDEQ